MFSQIVPSLIANAIREGKKGKFYRGKISENGRNVMMNNLGKSMMAKK
jgi:hypothetical protein